MAAESQELAEHPQQIRKEGMAICCQALARRMAGDVRAQNALHWSAKALLGEAPLLARTDSHHTTVADEILYVRLFILEGARDTLFKREFAAWALEVGHDVISSSLCETESTTQRRRYNTTQLGKSEMASVPGRFSFNIPDMPDFDRGERAICDGEGNKATYLTGNIRLGLVIDERKREQLLEPPVPSLVLRGLEYESDPDMEEVD